MVLLTLLFTFLKLHWLDLLLVLIFIAVLVILWKLGYKKVVIKVIRKLVAEAEQKYGSKTGSIKWTEVYVGLPWFVKLFWTQEEINNFIKDAVAWLDKELEQTDANLLTYAQERQQLPAKAKKP